ncbi:SulP family inorganic anion transporter [Hoeflea sp. CAU 1731]
MSQSAESQSRRPILQPKILTTIREYSWPLFWSDLLAGATVAMVALPLSLAIAIASGADPVKGLVTAVVGGFFISALGGSRVQIGGPTGAFIVVVFGVIAEHGYDGLVIATAMAGALLVIAGYLRIGNLIAFVPDAVVNGFTIGIALIIATSQLQDFLGLSVENVPADFLEKLPVLWEARATVTLSAILIAVLTMALIVILRKRYPRFPGILLAVAVGSGLAAALSLPVDTIASRFGALPSEFPMPRLPDLSPERLIELFPSAVVIAFLAGVESLLSAMVADRMIDGKHRPNAEIVGQGIANLASSLFGGMPATGAIARTATNVKAGGKTPVAGLSHAVIILLFMLFAAPLAGYLALPALAALLMLTAWNMSEPHNWPTYAKLRLSDRVLLILTLVLTVVVDLTVAIGVGVSIGLALRLARRRPPQDWHLPDR